MKSWFVVTITLVIVCLGIVQKVESLGCPCLGGLVFSPSGSNSLVVPAGKRVEEEFQRFISSWIGQSLRGPYARAYYNLPRDLRDYAYENSKVMWLEGAVQYKSFPTSCQGCNYAHWQQQRQIAIADQQKIDFSSVGFPLQSVTGGRGWCVLSVDEYYGYSPYYSPTVLLEDILSRGTAGGNTANFGNLANPDPLGPLVPEPGPHFYGIGIYTETEQGGGPFYATIIKVILVKQPDCTCASTMCPAGSLMG